VIEEYLCRVDECMTHSTYKKGLGYERCEDKGETSTKFVLSSTYTDVTPAFCKDKILPI
jgi:hypothetical protein